MLILDFDILQYSHYICKIFKETYHCLILPFLLPHKLNSAGFCLFDISASCSDGTDFAM